MVNGDTGTWRILILLRVWWQIQNRQSLLKSGLKHLHCTRPCMFMWRSFSGFFFINNALGLLYLFPQNSTMVELGEAYISGLLILLAFICLHALAHWKVVRANWRRLLGCVKTRFARHQRADDNDVIAECALPKLLGLLQ